jgi:hypothetical protein
MAVAAAVTSAAASAAAGSAGLAGSAAASDENSQVFTGIDGESAPDHGTTAAETRPASAPARLTKFTRTGGPTSPAVGFDCQRPRRWHDEGLRGVDLGEVEDALQPAFAGDTADR